MLREDKAFKLIEIFITCDDFCNALTQWQTQQGCLPTTRQGELSDSEMMTITVFYHYSGYKCFQYYDKVSRKPRVFRPGMNWNSRRLRYFNIQWLTC